MILLEDVRDMKAGESKRFLIDREWPRGYVRYIPHKERTGGRNEALAEIHWCPRLAPETALWAWFQANLDQADRFQFRYFKELERRRTDWLPLAQEAMKGSVKLLYHAKYAPSAPAHFFKKFLETQLSTGSVPEARPKCTVQPGRGVAAPVEKSIHRKSKRPLRKGMRFKTGDKLTFAPPEKRRIL